MKQYLSISILLELAKKQRVTAKYLANKFEISTRSVYRYLNELESAGIPTFSTPGKNGGIGIQKTFILDRLLLTNEDKVYLKQALCLLKNEKSEILINKLDL